MAITNRENRRYILLNLVHHFGPISRKKADLSDRLPASQRFRADQGAAGGRAVGGDRTFFHRPRAQACTAGYQ